MGHSPSTVPLSITESSLTFGTVYLLNPSNPHIRELHINVYYSSSIFTTYVDLDPSVSGMIVSDPDLAKLKKQINKKKNSFFVCETEDVFIKIFKCDLNLFGRIRIRIKKIWSRTRIKKKLGSL